MDGFGSALKETPAFIVTLCLQDLFSRRQEIPLRNIFYHCYSYFKFYFILKDKKKEDKKDEISLEDLVEKERAALGPNQTRVTLETFLAWKKRKLREKEDSSSKENNRKKAEFKAGRSVGVSSQYS